MSEARKEENGEHAERKRRQEEWRPELDGASALAGAREQPLRNTGSARTSSPIPAYPKRHRLGASRSQALGGGAKKRAAPNSETTRARLTFRIQ